MAACSERGPEATAEALGVDDLQDRGMLGVAHCCVGNLKDSV